MGQFNSLINAAYKAINNANTLLESDSTPFNVMYKQYKTLQSLWFRVVDDAADSNNKYLEETCVDLEDAVQRCEEWIRENSPTRPQAPKTELEETAEVSDTSE